MGSIVRAKKKRYGFLLSPVHLRRRKNLAEYGGKKRPIDQPSGTEQRLDTWRAKSSGGFASFQAPREKLLAFSGYQILLVPAIDEQIGWFQSRGLIARSKNCLACNHQMNMQTRSDITDKYR